MSKEQQINQITYLKHQNQQAYLLYCQQTIAYLYVLNWLKVIYLANESAIYNEKRTLSPKNLNQAKHPENSPLKPLKHKEKLQNKEKVALGKSLARYEYDAYGNLLTQAGSSETPFGFTGYQKDDDTGLYYANARYYNPEEGRFLRNDPLEGNVQDPPSLHRYLYANANPTSFIDPTGKANDTSHYYEALLIGKLVGLGEGDLYSYALGAQVGDEFEHQDAIENSVSFVANIGKAMFSSLTLNVKGFLDATAGAKEAVINNCGGHALCGASPLLVRNAVKEYTLNNANNYGEIGTADHAHTDSFFHIKLATLGTNNEQSHKTIAGHLDEWTTTDKSFYYHHSKRRKAFEARARLLYKFSVNKGTQQLSESEFENKLQNMLTSLDKQNNKLLRSHQSLETVGGGVRTFVTNYKDIKDNEEFDSMIELLAQNGITNIPRTERSNLASDITGLLNQFSQDKLIAIAISMNPSANEQAIRHLSKKRLVDNLSYRFNRAQNKSKQFIYFEALKNSKKPDIVKENEDKPGIKELSK